MRTYRKLLDVVLMTLALSSCGYGSPEFQDNIAAQSLERVKHIGSGTVTWKNYTISFERLPGKRDIRVNVALKPPFPAGKLSGGLKAMNAVRFYFASEGPCRKSSAGKIVRVVFDTSSIKQTCGGTWTMKIRCLSGG